MPRRPAVQTPRVLEVSPLAWAVTAVAVVSLLTLDLMVATRRPHAVGFREAVAWSVFYIAVAVGFGVGFGLVADWESGAEYFTGYAVEKSLSVDNLFVFVIIMSTFAVPPEHQHRVLTFGIAVALALRAVFIALGAALLSLFSFMFLLFGLLLVVTGIQLFRHRDQDPTSMTTSSSSRRGGCSRSPVVMTAAASLPARTGGACSRLSRSCSSRSEART